jgi:histidinol dehydrogenase
MMLPILEVARLDAAARRAALARPNADDRDQLVARVRETVARVRTEGDDAALDYARRFDGGAPANLRVPQAEIAAAMSVIGDNALSALRRAIDNVRKFHQAQLAPELSIETSPGVRCERVFRPIDAVGLYVPGGSAPLPSALIMSAVPASIAGCPRRILCSPGTRQGRIDPVILATAQLCGIDEVFALGGAQAIAAMAYGTQTIPKVDKIFGPGSAWVTAAKQIVAEDPLGAALDLPAGPSEVLVIADETADAVFVAADLLAQAEHDPLSQAILLTTSPALAAAVREHALRFLGNLSRQHILEQSLARSRILLVTDLDTAIALSNDYAPEHLILQVSEPRRRLPQITAAGSVFLGPWSPEPLGDYCSGTNHVLPTYGFARAYSGLSVGDFQRRITIQELTPAGLADLGPVAETLAGLEGLDAHALAVSVRLGKLATAANETSDIAAATAAATAMAAQALVNRLARPSIVALRAYEHAHWDPRFERLHANESPWPPASAPSSTLHRYPEPQPADLRDALANLYHVDRDQLLIGRGSDEAIDLLTRAFCEASRDRVVVCPPTFGMYAVAASIQGARVVEVPLLEGFQLDCAGIEAAIDGGSKLIWLCSPNNPTGNLLRREHIERVLRAARGRCLVIVDEAYAEFSPEPSWSERLNEFPQLLVLRTLSKAHALAGARIGVVLGAAPLIALLRKIIPPYAIASDSAAAAFQAVTAATLPVTTERIAALVRERDRLATELNRSPWIVRIHPSAANFLLVETTDAPHVFERIKSTGLVVRDFSGKGGLGAALRISIGTPVQNDRVLAALRVASPLAGSRQ